MSATRPPLVHAAAAGLAAFALATGGTVTFQGLARLPVRPVALVLLGGLVLHAASRYAAHGPLVRGATWSLWAAGAALSGPLAIPPIVGGIAAAGLLDLAFHAGDDPAPAHGDPAVGVAAIAAVTGVVAAVAAAHLAAGAGVAARLALAALAAGGLVAAYALRPAVRTPGRLLAGALAYGVVFRVLASPVLPLGPILAYWVLVGAAGLALLAGTRTRLREPLPAGLRRHEQHVARRPDPLDRGLEAALRAYLDGTASPDRVRRAVARHDAGLADEAAALPDRTAPRARRARALEQVLETPLPEENP